MHHDGDGLDGAVRFRRHSARQLDPGLGALAVSEVVLLEAVEVVFLEVVAVEGFGEVWALAVSVAAARISAREKRFMWYVNSDRMSNRSVSGEAHYLSTTDFESFVGPIKVCLHWKKVLCQLPPLRCERDWLHPANIPASKAVRGARCSSRTDSCAACAPSPTAPMPSRVGMPRAEVKLPSDAPPVEASSSANPSSAARAWACDRAGRCRGCAPWAGG